MGQERNDYYVIMGSLEIVHVHGFKCAGTTFSASLAANYLEDFRCIEPANPRIMGWDEVSAKANDLEIKALSSHSLCIPKNTETATTFVHLIREPSARWNSAWRFESKVQQRSVGSFSDYLGSQTVNRNLQSKFLLQDHSDWNTELFVEESEMARIFPHRPNVFLGVVERYEESMVVLEDLLKKKSLRIDLSYPAALNKSEQLMSESGNAEEVPEEFENLDRKLLQLANIRLDLQISLTPNFQDLLSDFRARCKLSKESPELFESRVSNDNWALV